LTNFERQLYADPTATSTPVVGTSSSVTSTIAPARTTVTCRLAAKIHLARRRPSTYSEHSTESCSHRSSTRRSPSAAGVSSTGRSGPSCSLRDVFGERVGPLGPRSWSAPPVAPLSATHLGTPTGALNGSRTQGPRRRSSPAAQRGVGRATAEMLAAEGAGLPARPHPGRILREADGVDLLAAGAEDAIGLECNLLDSGEVGPHSSFLDERWGELPLSGEHGRPRAGSAGVDDLSDAAWPRSSTSGCSP